MTVGKRIGGDEGRSHSRQTKAGRRVTIVSHMNYRLRLVIGILSVIAPLLVLMTMNRMSIIRDFIYVREMNRLNSIGQLVICQLLVDEVEDNLAHESTDDEIAEILALSALQPDIVRVNVLDTSGRVAYTSDSSRRGQRALYENTNEFTDIRDETYVKSFNMNVPNGRYSLQILYSLVKAHGDFAIAFRWAIIFDFLIFAAAGLMAWLVSGFMERPVRAATAAAQRIARGDFDVSLVPVTRDAYGKLVEALGHMAVDLRQLTHGMQERIDAATVELTKKNRRLKELDRLKSEFVAMVSHELRTPLTSIIGFARTLKRLPMAEDKKIECLSIIEKESKHLSLLIEDYLDVSKIETGNFSLSCSWVNIEKNIREIVDIFPWTANVKLHIDNNLPEVYADSVRLRRVFRNILENAIRHGGKDVAIEVRACRQADAVEVSITDNGPGIPLDVRVKIFDKFFRADPHRGGSGLGLTMVKAIVEAHGGDVRCESEHGVGTTFFVRLPVMGPTEQGGVIYGEENSGS